jgi:hypothetical protein
MVFSLFCVGVDVPEMEAAWFFSSFSGVIVDVDVEREKVLVRGPRWVSFNSRTRHCQFKAARGGREYGQRILLVSFHDMPDIATTSRSSDGQEVRRIR